MLSPRLIEKVEPAYVYIASGSAEREARLRGARLHLRPLPSLNRETLQRSIECHQVHVVLGAAPGRADDPYAQAAKWLRIDTDSDGDGFLVDVRTDDLATAKEVLSRARLVVAANRTADAP